MFKCVVAAEEKEPYESMARADKKRYTEEITGYKNQQSINMDTTNREWFIEVGCDPVYTLEEDAALNNTYTYNLCLA